jgi:L-glyceraldehyde 3-phosphate reductase
MAALDLIVRQGKALYVGVSNYNADQTREAYKILKSMGTPILIHQPKYSMFVRWIEDGLIQTLEELGIGCISFSPLAQGLLTKKYFKGIPKNSRAAKKHGFLKKEEVTEETINKVKALNEIAGNRGQTISQLALAWNLRHSAMTTVLIGASSVKQVEENAAVINNLELSADELNSIENILK